VLDELAVTEPSQDVAKEALQGSADAAPVTGIATAVSSLSFSTAAAGPLQQAAQQDAPAAATDAGIADAAAASRGSSGQGGLAQDRSIPIPSGAPECHAAITGCSSRRSCKCRCLLTSCAVLLGAVLPEALPPPQPSTVGLDTPANGNGGHLYGDSPRSGWEGADSELGFPLDDVPRDRHAALQPGAFALGTLLCSRLSSYVESGDTALFIAPVMWCTHINSHDTWRLFHAGAADLPETAALKPLVVPPKSPLRSALAAPALPDSSAALAQALQHGDEVLPPLLAWQYDIYALALSSRLSALPCAVGHCSWACCDPCMLTAGDRKA
jgi:hypothetical protein